MFSGHARRILSLPCLCVLCWCLVMAVHLHPLPCCSCFLQSKVILLVPMGTLLSLAPSLSVPLLTALQTTPVLCVLGLSLYGVLLWGNVAKHVSLRWSSHGFCGPSLSPCHISATHCITCLAGLCVREWASWLALHYILDSGL